jgi:hypothetical protein
VVELAGRSRRLALVAWPALGLGVAVLAASGACVQSGASLGQSCLTDQDCFSGQCSQQKCVSAGPLLDAEATGDPPSTPPGEASTDGSGEASTDGAPTDGAVDASPSVEGGDASRPDATPDAPPGDAPSEGAAPETGADAPVDSPAESAVDSAVDSPVDTGTDSASDAPQDASSAG